MWARHNVPFGESPFYAGGNGHEWLYCGDKQIKHSVTDTTDGENVLK